METTINFAAKGLKEIDALEKVEFVVTDWGSQIPLASALNLSEEAVLMTRFIYIPESFGIDSKTGVQKFKATLSFNCCLRRARGTYRALCGADAIIPASSLRALLDVLEEKVSTVFNPELTYLNCGRFDLPWDFIGQQPSLSEIERYLAINSWNISCRHNTNAPGFIGGGTGFIVMHENIMEDSGGLDERLENFGWSDIDFTFRFMSKYACCDLRSFGFMFYDMGHCPSKGDRVNVTRNPQYINENIKANNKDWGLPAYVFEEQTAQARVAQEKQQSYEVWQVDQENKSLLKELRNFLFKLSIEKLPTQTICAREGLVLRLIAELMNNNTINRYLEFGVKPTYAIATAAHYNQYLEMYGIDNWEEIDNISGPHYIGRIISSALVNCKGYGRFLGGDKQTALERLKNSFIGECWFDLVVVRESFLETHTLEVIREVLPLLKPQKGSLIFIAENDLTLKKTSALIRDIYNDAVYISHVSNVALIILDPLKRISGAIKSPLPFLPEGQIEKHSHSTARLIFFGAGKYCDWILRRLNNAAIKLPEFIIDDHSTRTQINNIPVLKPQNFRERESDLFVMATDTHQMAFRQRLAELYPHHQIIDLYPTCKE